MNSAHNLFCCSRWWGRRVERELLPWGLSGVELGDDVLEIGPGFGATTKVLATRPIKLSALEFDEGSCARLLAALGDTVSVTQGDATSLPFENGRFSAAVCFTMLHHIPTAALCNYWADDALERQTVANGERIGRRLIALADEFGGEEITARGRGMTYGLAFADADLAGRVSAEAFELGLLVERAGPRDEVVKLLPPLTATEQELDHGLRLLADAVSAVC